MILILCVDDQMGIAFNHRRQSKDRVLTDRIKEITKGKTFWTDPYSAKLFEDTENMKADEECLTKAGEGEFCFVETKDPSLYQGKVEKLILFQWNRRYPASIRFTMGQGQWECISTTDFPGYSHDKITEEVYIPCGKR